MQIHRVDSAANMNSMTFSSQKRKQKKESDSLTGTLRTMPAIVVCV